MEKELPKLPIEKLFHTLGEKLSILEQQFSLGKDLEVEDFGPCIQDTMDSICREVDVYGNNEVVAICKSYIQRIDRLKTTLRVGGPHDHSWSAVEFIEYTGRERSYTDEEKKEALRYAHEGLNYGKGRLLDIIENHAFSLSSDAPVPKPTSVVTEIKLPDNFTVKQLTAHFTPFLSLRQATLFLFYLRENGVIPNYSASGLGQLAEYFFARNNKNIREELTNIHENRQNSEDLKAMQKVLKSILKEVANDLENAR